MSLQGKRIVITRAAHQCAATTTMIQQRGAQAVLFPCLKMQVNTAALRAALEQAASFSDLLITSANTVEALRQLMRHEINADIAVLWRSKRIACVGETTAKALAGFGIHADIVPDRSQSSQQGLVDCYTATGWPQSLLFLRAEAGSDVLAMACRQRQIPVQMVAAYRMVCPDDDASAMRRQLAAGQIDAVLLGSSRTVRHYLQRIGDAALASQACLVAISPQVAAVISQSGMRVGCVAATPSFAAMLDAAEASICTSLSDTTGTDNKSLL